MSLTFFKDILDPAMGRFLISTITKIFNDRVIQFVDSNYVDRVMESGINESELIKSLDNTPLVDFDHHLEYEWKRKNWESTIIILESTDKLMEIIFQCPSEGGVAAKHVKDGLHFYEGQIQIKLKMPRADDPIKLRTVLTTLCEPLQASYGFVTNSSQYKPALLSRKFPGVYWCTLLGDDYLVMMSQPNFERCRLFATSKLDNGSLLLQIMQTINECHGWQFTKRTLCVKSKIGLKWFIPKAWHKSNHVPLFHNLKVPSDA